MYTQADFRSDLDAIKRAATHPSANARAQAVKRGRSLLAAAGSVGNIICGGNRSQLQQAVAHCESTLASEQAGSAGPEPAQPQPEPAADPAGAPAAGAGGAPGGTVHVGGGGGNLDGGGAAGGAPTIVVPTGAGGGSGGGSDGASE